MSEEKRLSDLEKICLKASFNNETLIPLEVFEMINEAYNIGFRDGMNRNN